MHRSTRRLVVLALALIAFLVVTALFYQVGMQRLEGKPRTFWQALEWAGESLSTTGYGADSKWLHPLMVIFVVGIQFIGVFLVFLIIPIYLVPFLEERFEERVPRRADPSLAGHVVVYRSGPAVESLLQRLTQRSIPVLVVETDEAKARAVRESGQNAVFVRTDDEVVDACRIEHARAIVANGADEENAALVLRARQLGFTRDIFAFVEDPAHRQPMELAGATAAYTPRHIIAAALAAHASDQLSPRLPGLHHVRNVARREVRIGPASPMAGKTLREAQLPCAVVGIWSRSRLSTRCTGQTVIEPHSVVELVGDIECLEAAAALLGSPLLRHEGVFLIGGFGEVGQKVHELLTDAGEEVRVIERTAGPDVDVVGDVLDTSVLERAGIAEARALVLALDSDDATLFATVIARDLASDVTVIARVNHARNVDNIHRAGADYALSISEISGEMLSSRLLGREARVREEHRRIQVLEGTACAGQSVEQLMTGEGRTVIAIERGGEMLSRLEPGMRIDPGDRVWVCTLRV